MYKMGTLNGDSDEYNDKKYSKKLSVSKSTFNLVVDDCIPAFLKDNPDFQGMKITQNFIVRRMAKMYLKM